MKTILAVCRKASTITDEALTEAESTAREQLAYIHPLKNATAAKQHALGEHNLRVITALRNLRDAINAGAKLARKEAA